MRSVKGSILIVLTLMAVFCPFAAPVAADERQASGPQNSAAAQVDGKHGSSGQNPGRGVPPHGEWSREDHPNPGAWGRGGQPQKQGPGSVEVVLDLLPRLIAVL
ncbi:MAG: hypothetical protein JSW34_09420 [Candidatus Zixiibacteriota bacterium]|nr:MAG: hypothetical protein JSW34_09420 [candidate division Zixibacteria bacterium]